MSGNKPQYSEKSHLRLVEVKPTSFAGISEEQNLVVMLPENENVVIASGDQGTCKTSFLECLKYGLTGIKPINATNSKDKKEDVFFAFKDKDGAEFQIRATKSSFNIFKIEHAGTPKETRSKLESPKSWLRNNIGEIGVDPVGLRSMKPEQQIDWVRQMVQFNEEQAKAEQELKKKIKETTTSRKAVNSVRGNLKKTLLISGYFVEKVKHGKELAPTAKYKQDETLYQEEASQKQANALKKLEEATNTQQKMALKEQELTQLNVRKETVEKEIEDLQERLKKAIEMRDATDRQIAEVKTEMQEYTNAHEEVRTAREEVESIQKYISEQTLFRSVQEDKAHYDEAIDKYDRLDAVLTTANEEYEKFVASITPDIEGLEVCIPADVDVKDELAQYKDANPDATEEQIAAEQDRLEKKNREGIYVNGKTVYELSESELLAFCIKCWKYSGVRMLVIENLSSYGTDAIKTINEFAKAGAQVFASLMERGKNKMEISFYPEIPEKI